MAGRQTRSFGRNCAILANEEEAFRISSAVRPVAAGGRAHGHQPHLPALLYREEGLTVRKRRARRRAVGVAGPPIVVESKPNARWSVDFVHDQLACGRRFPPS